MREFKYADLIGTPFEYNGRDAKSYDCYGLLRVVYERYHNIALPDHISPANGDGAVIAKMMLGDLKHWKLCEMQAGAVLYIRAGRYRQHVGFCLDEGRFIHTHENSGGVCVERTEDWKHRILGIYQYAASH